MLPSKNRLKKQKDFKKVIETKPFFGEFITLKKVKNDQDQSRFGFVVSKKISNKATVRNKIKRRMRAIIREKKDSIKKGFDIVFFAKTNINSASYKKLEIEIEQLLNKSNLKQ